MSSNPLPLFLNPTAGRGRAGKRLPQIEKILGEQGITIDVYRSGSIGDLEKQVAAVVRSGASRVIVAGGDGSMHEAVNGVLGTNPSCAIGLIPTGTGNDFAKAAGITLNWQDAARLLGDRIASDAHARQVDAGRMNGRYFANGAGIGFDAKVTRIAQAYRWPIGDLVYLYAIFRAMVDGIITPDVEITSDDFSWSGPLTLANIANGPWVGGMFHIAPPADQADGIFDLVIAAPVTRRRIVALIPKLIAGRHFEEEEITHAQVRNLHVESTAPVPSHLDGEVQPLATRFEIELLPGALRLI